MTTPTQYVDLDMQNLLNDLGLGLSLPIWPWQAMLYGDPIAYPSPSSDTTVGVDNSLYQHLFSDSGSEVSRSRVVRTARHCC